jgi:NADH:ubiquinone oxidoreductase subunit K
MLINLFLVVSFFIFTLSIFGLLVSRNNLITILVCLELMLLSINFNFVILTYQFDDIFGQVLYFFLLALAGSEAAIGLSILIIFYRLRGLISINYLNYIKG